MKNLTDQTEKLLEVYEKAKENLLRITVCERDAAFQTELFQNIKELKDIAAEAILNSKEVPNG